MDRGTGWCDVQTNPAATMPVGRDAPHPTAGRAAHAEPLSFEVGRSGGHRLVVCLADRAGELTGTEQMEHADRLRRTEHEVEPGHRPGWRNVPERSVANRVAPLEKVTERHGHDPTPQSEHLGAATTPDAGRLPRHTGSLRTTRHEVSDVVRGLPGSEYLHPQHRDPATRATSTGYCTISYRFMSFHVSSR